MLACPDWLEAWVFICMYIHALCMWAVKASLCFCAVSSEPLLPKNVINNLMCWPIILTNVLLDPNLSILENAADPDQLAFDKAIWSGSILFFIHFWKHCRSRSAGFWWNNLIRIHTVYPFLKMLQVQISWLLIKPYDQDPQFCSFFESTADPDQLASDEAIWSGSTLFFTDRKFVLSTGFKWLFFFNTIYMHILLINDHVFKWYQILNIKPWSLTVQNRSTC